MQKRVPKTGDEFIYCRSKNHEHVVLTYVETMPDGKYRFFSSQKPSLEYHLEKDSPSISPCNDEPNWESLDEKYHAFKGDDKAKQQAYHVLLARRGIEH